MGDDSTYNKMMAALDAALLGCKTEGMPYATRCANELQVLTMTLAIKAKLNEVPLRVILSAIVDAYDGVEIKEINIEHLH
jgi:hypothetical protein